MAENAVAAPESTMPAFIRAGMDFFTGKTVLASTLAEANEKLSAADARIAELVEATSKLSDTNARVVALEADLEKANASIKEQSALIKTLEASRVSAAQMAQRQVAQAGAKAPVATGPSADESQKAKLTFVDRVAAKISAGAKKTDAIRACITEFPDDYVAWLKSGNTSSI